MSSDATLSNQFWFLELFGFRVVDTGLWEVFKQTPPRFLTSASRWKVMMSNDLENGFRVIFLHVEFGITWGHLVIQWKYQRTRDMERRLGVEGIEFWK